MDSAHRDPHFRWDSLIASAYLMLTSGSMYFFSSYSADLANLMEYDNTQLNRIGTAGNAGAWFAILGGLHCDRYGPFRTAIAGALMIYFGYCLIGLSCDGLMPQNSWFVASCAFLAAQGSGWSYLGSIKAALHNFDIQDRGSVVGALVCFFALCGGFFSQTYKTIFQNYVALSTFFYCVATTIGATQLLCAHVIRKESNCRNPVGERERSRLFSLLGVGIVLSIWLLIMAVSKLKVGARWFALMMYAVAVLIVVGLAALRKVWRVLVPLNELEVGHGDRFSPGSIPPLDEITEDIEEELKDAGPFEKCGKTGVFQNLPIESHDDLHLRRPTVPIPGHLSSHTDVETDVETAVKGHSQATTGVLHLSDLAPAAVDPATPVTLNSTFSQRDASEGDEDVEMKGLSPKGHRTDISKALADSVPLRRALCMPTYWLLIVGYMSGLGYGITLVNNVGTLVASLQPVAAETVWTANDDGVKVYQMQVASLVALFSVFNAWGRILTGQLADFIERKFKLPRVLFLALAALVLLISNLVTLSLSIPALFFSTALCGLGVGGIFASAPVATGDIFGLTFFSTHWGFMGIAPCISTEVLSSLVAGKIMDEHAKRSFFIMNGRNYCLGTECYRLTFWITLAVLGFSIVTTMSLFVIRWRKLKD